MFQEPSRCTYMTNRNNTSHNLEHLKAKRLFSYSHVNILFLVYSENDVFGSGASRNDFLKILLVYECWPRNSTSSGENRIQIGCSFAEKSPKNLCLLVS